MDEDFVKECDCCGFESHDLADVGARTRVLLCLACRNAGCELGLVGPTCPGLDEPGDLETDEEYCAHCGSDCPEDSGFCAQCESEMML